MKIQSIQIANRALIPALLLLAMLACFARPAPPANQQQPLLSPSGLYRLTVPIEERVWRVTIATHEGDLLYQDTEADFVGNLNVYWLWDEQERVWLYSSDTGAVFFWELQDGAWVKTLWGYGREREINRDLVPPPALYPSYVE